MAEEKLIPINVIVADRSYRIRIRPEEEESIRKALKTVNEKIIELKTSFAGKDLQDYISMCLIMYATQPAAGEPAGSSSETESQLLQMESLIDQALED